jgi:hypothetical protein
VAQTLTLDLPDDFLADFLGALFLALDFFAGVFFKDFLAFLWILLVIGLGHPFSRFITQQIAINPRKFKGCWGFKVNKLLEFQ